MIADDDETESTEPVEGAEDTPESVEIGEDGMEIVADGADGEAPILERRDESNGNRHKRAIFSVPVHVVVSVGRAKPTIGELLAMKRDALLPLNTKLDDPVDIMVGRRVVARGELQEIEDGDGQLGVRLTEIVDLSEPF